MAKIAFYTLGCKVNQADTASMENLFLRSGHQLVSFDGEADVYIINTCVVTNTGQRKSRQTIHRAIRKNPSTQHVPVIMISGNEHATEQFYANRIGADDFMKKPFSRFEIFARIENLLDASQMPRRKAA